MYVCIVSFLFMYVFSRPLVDNPHNFDIDSEVIYQGKRAVIKWIGALLGDKHVFAGLEMVMCM